jgi:hypothetical protein
MSEISMMPREIIFNPAYNKSKYEKEMEKK